MLVGCLDFIDLDDTNINLDIYDSSVYTSTR